MDKQRLLELAGVQLNETVWYSSYQFQNELKEVFQQALSALETYSLDDKTRSKAISAVNEILKQLK